MPRFLAVYTMHAARVAAFRALPKAEQDAIDARGLKAWAEWDTATAPHIVSPGGMVGKTLRVTAEGTAPATNTICGYVVVEAETIQAAAKLFETHPHITIFPGDTVDIMPFVTAPPD
jgi:hypothetical protein